MVSSIEKAQRARAEKIFAALVAKTRKNGCTEGEAKAAREKAEEYAKKYGFQLPPLEPEFSEEEIMEKAEENEKQEAAKKKAKAKKAAAKPKGDTIRAFAEHLLKTQPELKHKEVAEKVRERFPDAKTSAASVAWYASKLKRK